MLNRLNRFITLFLVIFFGGAAVFDFTLGNIELGILETIIFLFNLRDFFNTLGRKGEK